jgi:hypothetical protein
MWLFKLVLIVATLSVALYALIYFAQTRLIFPTRLAEMYQAELPASAIRLEIETGDSVRLSGVHIPSGSGRDDEPVLLGFGGNAGMPTVLPNICMASSPTRRWSPSTIAATDRAAADRAPRRCSPTRRSSTTISSKASAIAASSPSG